MNEAGTIAALLQNQRLMEARIAALEAVILRGGALARDIADLVRKAVEQT